MRQPTAFAIILASVVFPRPGGPLNRMWSSTSSRCLAASTISIRRSLIFSWPQNSLKAGGLRDKSKAEEGASVVRV